MVRLDSVIFPHKMSRCADLPLEPCLATVGEAFLITEKSKDGLLNKVQGVHAGCLFNAGLTMYVVSRFYIRIK